jgi:pyruvate,water dikinase
MATSQSRQAADPGEEPLIRWFSEISIRDVPLVGGKNASLGEMYQKLTGKGVRVPNGFALTAHAYRYFLRANDLETRIEEQLEGLDTHDIEDLRERGKAIRNLILDATLPDEIRTAVTAAYEELGGTDVAVRSSATAEDLPDASFAGQQDTFLNVHGSGLLLMTVTKCFASLFTDRAISYRVDKGFNHMDVALSVCIQTMVRSDLAGSGVMFSIDTETGFQNAVLISAAWGLGENVVQGTVNPDEYYVFKPTLQSSPCPVLRRTLGEKAIKMVYDHSGSRLTKNIPVPQSEQDQLVLNDDELLTLAKWAVEIEQHYSQAHDRYTPMDIEWAKDGKTGELFIVQARPETVHATHEANEITVYNLREKGKLLTSGRAVGDKIGQGPLRVIEDTSQLHTLKDGEVLVADRTDPDWEPAMKRASAIVTNRGSRTCHAAIVSRELGLPAVVGCGDATEALSGIDGEITVDCSHGDTGNVYEGKLDVEIQHIELTGLKSPNTKIMMNVANPDEAFRLSALPNSGVGLARLEFIINNAIKVHPMALVKYDELEAGPAKDEIARLTRGYEDKQQFFVDRLAEGVGMIGAAFWPNDVIVRMSDFKTNEYSHLLGGQGFEPEEENPMIGFRGASRYYDDRYREGFALECAAMKKVRDDMGLSNVKLMIPFCRTVEEGKKVLAEMEAHGLKRGENALEVYVMCEIPANVICADQFAEHFDGFSIGSNDLTQLTLGVDRDSELIEHLFDERNDAVKRMVSLVIREAKKAGRKIGICGQAPSDYPEFAEFLVREGIDSISLNPDAVVKTAQAIAALESSLEQ